jgi:hypothetical protein
MFAKHLKEKILADPENHPHKELLEFLPDRKDNFNMYEEVKLISIIRKYKSINYQHITEQMDNNKTPE